MSLRTIADVASLVRSRRTELGLSQAAVADKAGVSRKLIIGVEAGQATVQLGLLLRVIDALGLMLTTVDFAPSASDVELDELIADYRHG